MANLITSGVFSLGSLGGDREAIAGDEYLNDVVLLMKGDNNLSDETGRHTPTATSAAFSTDTPFASSSTHSMSFNGTSSGEITLPYSTDFQFGADQFTVEMWFKWDGTTGVNSLFNTYTGAGHDGIALAINNGFMGVWVSINGSSWSIDNQSGGFSPTANTWHHVALTRQSNNDFELFFDGVKGTTLGNLSSNSVWDNSQPAHIGSNGGFFYYNGLIDEVRITKGVARYTGDFTPPTSALSADVSGITGSDDVVLLLDGSSDTTDASGTQTISETGNVTPVTGTGHPYATSSLDFDTSVTSYLQTGITNDFKFGTEPFTIEFWMKPTTLNTSASNASYSTIMENESGSTYNGSWFVVNQLNGEIYFAVNSGATSITTSSSEISTASWSHVAIVRDSSNTCTIYVDGVSKGSATISQNLTDLNDRTLVVGKQLSVARRYDGQLTDIRITKGAALYPFTPPTEAFPTTVPVAALTRPTRKWGGITGRSFITSATPGSSAWIDTIGYETFTTTGTVTDITTPPNHKSFDDGAYIDFTGGSTTADMRVQFRFLRDSGATGYEGLYTRESGGSGQAGSVWTRSGYLYVYDTAWRTDQYAVSYDTWYWLDVQHSGTSMTVTLYDAGTEDTLGTQLYTNTYTLGTATGDHSTVRLMAGWGTTSNAGRGDLGVVRYNVGATDTSWTSEFLPYDTAEVPGSIQSTGVMTLTEHYQSKL